MKIEFLIREKDLLETQMLIASKSNSLRKRRWIGTVFVTACLPVFCLFLDRYMQSFGLFETVIAIAISVLAGGLYFFLIPYTWRRHYMNQVKTRFADIIGNSVELQITNDAIETKGKTGETKVELTAIKKVYETGNLFVIQSCNGEYLTIAKQDIDFVRFRESLAAHGLNLETVGKMKKMIIVICLCLLPFAYVHSQSEVALDCNLNLESIFKVHDLKIRYEAVDYVYNARRKNSKFIFFKDSSSLNSLFELIRGFPMESKEQQDSIPQKTVGFDEAVRLQKEGIKPGELVKVEWMSEEEMDQYIEQLNCTPQEAIKEYLDIIRGIKLEKELYLQCIDAELVKGDLSEYAKVGMLYKFLEPGMSVIGPPWKFTKLDFLKVFKEFVINDNEEVLPDGMRVHAYLKCGCKIP
jgi:hypothetical protein